MKDDEFAVENTIFDCKFYLVNSSELNEKKIYKKDDVIDYFKKKNEKVYNIITKKNKNDEPPFPTQFGVSFVPSGNGAPI